MALPTRPRWRCFLDLLDVRALADSPPIRLRQYRVGGRDRGVDSRRGPRRVLLRPGEPAIRSASDPDRMLCVHRHRVPRWRGVRERRHRPRPVLDLRFGCFHHVSRTLLLRLRGESSPSPGRGVWNHLWVPVARRVAGVIRSGRPCPPLPDPRRIRGHGTLPTSWPPPPTGCPVPPPDTETSSPSPQSPHP